MVDLHDASAPQTGDVISDGTRRLDGLRATFDSGRTRPVAWRKQQLEGLLRLLGDHEADLAATLATDLGRSQLEAYTADIGVTRAHVRSLLNGLESWVSPERVFPGTVVMPATAEIRPEPLGVVLVIAPWNFPVLLLIEPIAAAFAAGNCVAAKPSELSAATSALLARLLPQYVDADALAVFEGGVEVSTALLAERFDHIFFTGSVEVGRVVMHAAARHLTPVTLELGGKSPAVVSADADIKQAARRIMWGKLLNAGQACISPDYVLVERSVQAQLVEELGRALTRFHPGGSATAPEFARIINERHHDRLVGLLDNCGGTIAYGGEYDRASRYFAPTVVVDPDPDAALMTDEIFGPILPVIGVDSIDAAISFINRRPKPLSLYVFSTASSIADRVVDGTSSGGVVVNDCLYQFMPESLPFGGVGESGMGSYHGKAGFDTFTHFKPILRRFRTPDLPVMYAPHRSWKERVIRLLLR